MAQPKIKPIEVNGQTRYRFVVDVGRDPTTGKRKQLTRTFNRKKDAQSELARILDETNKGTFVAPSKITLNAYLDGWQEGVTATVSGTLFAMFTTRYVQCGNALAASISRTSPRPISKTW